MKKIYTIKNFAKRLVMMLAVGLMAVNAWADVAKWDYSSDGLSNTTKGQITVSYARNNGTQAVEISSNLLRLYRQNASPYNGCSATFTASSGYQITAIKVKFSGGRTSARGKIDNGSYQDVFSGGNSTTVTISSLTATSYSIQNQASGKTTVTIDSIVVTYSSTCDKKVTVSNGGSSTNGAITSITTSPVATCSSTASDRRVSIVVTPSTGYVAPEALSVGSTTGTVNSSKYSRTDNGNGTFTFVYEYNQNDNGTISYNAACVGKQCTVTFDKNSGTSGDNNVTATYGSAMTAIDPPTREHYDFAGYYDSETDNDGTGNKYYNADGSSAANWNKNTTAATTLYAKWTEHGLTNYRTVCSSTYNVTYDGNGNTDGSVPTDNTDYDSGDEVTVLGNSGSLVKTHYAFDGWNTKADGSGYPYAEDETFEITKNTTLYAQWACDENITISAGTPTNGSFTLSSTGDVETCSDDVVITVTPSPNTGYNFSAITQTGLNSGVTINQSDKTVTYDQYSSGTTTINVTFVAKTTTVTLNKNGATSGTNQTVSATYGLAMPTTTTASTDLVAPTKNGYTLLGYWDTDATTGGKQYYDANMTSVTSWDKEDATVTLYARWKAKVDRFIDDMHETTGYTSDSPHEESGASYTMPGPLSNTTPGGDCVTAHYIFVGWVLSTGQNSNGTLKDSGSRIYRPGETIHATNATYYAVWAEE